MARRNEHSKEELREKAITAAETIVLHEGYRSLNARRVAAEMDYTAGTLYLLFKNFDELIMHVNGRTLDALHAALVNEKTVEAMAVAYIHFAQQHKERWKLLYEYQPSSGNLRPEWYQGKLEGLFALVERALSEENSAIPSSQHRIAATALWGSIHGICILELDERLKLSVEQPAAEIARYMVRRFLNH